MVSKATLKHEHECSKWWTMTEFVDLGQVVQEFLERKWWQQLIAFCIVLCLLLLITANNTFNLNMRLANRQENVKNYIGITSLLSK